MPKRDNVCVGAGGKCRVCAKTPRSRVVSSRIHQSIGPLPIALRRLERHGVAYRMPGFLKIDEGAVLVEKNASNCHP
jgi:hypothetical protein